MSKLNRCCFTGYLGGDPRLHTFEDGTKIADLSVAISRRKKDDNGEWYDEPIWVDVKVQGYPERTQAVDAIGQYLHKGSFVAVDAQLAEPRMWQDNQGQTRFTVQFDHASVDFGPKVNSEPAAAAQAAAPVAQAASAQAEFADSDVPW